MPFRIDVREWVNRFAPTVGWRYSEVENVIVYLKRNIERLEFDLFDTENQFLYFLTHCSIVANWLREPFWEIVYLELNILISLKQKAIYGDSGYKSRIKKLEKIFHVRIY